MKDRLSELIHRFRQQEQFAAEYAPLYAALFGSMADWLADEEKDPLVIWLLHAAEGRAAFDVTNLMAAGLHREVLLGSGTVQELAAYYPTAAAYDPTKKLYLDNDAAGQRVSPGFKNGLREAILQNQTALKSFIQASTVQTNETGRGFVWLLPLLLTSWKGVHLVDIGASAGLNLVAEKRAYQFIDRDNDRILQDIGCGVGQQFVVNTSGELGIFGAVNEVVPQVLSRSGCDLHPFHLHSAMDEQTLASFVWADHVTRINRLREGITAFKEAKDSNVPVRLYEVRLPEELPQFLVNRVPNSRYPVIIYNTYIKMYLPEKGFALREHISSWAYEQQRPVLWLQWEPPNTILFDTGPEPQYGWLAWTLDYWFAGIHEQRRIGWVHPHGQQLVLEPDLKRWSPALRMA